MQACAISDWPLNGSATISTILVGIQVESPFSDSHLEVGFCDSYSYCFELMRLRSSSRLAATRVWWYERAPLSAGHL